MNKFKTRLSLAVFFTVLSLASACDNLFELKEKAQVDCKPLEIYPVLPPADFQLTFKVIRSPTYSYNSEDNCLRKLIDPFEEPDLYAETSIPLSPNQRKLIWEKIRDIDLLKYPKSFEPETGIEIVPEPSFQIKIKFDGTAKEVNWNKNTGAYCTEASNLMQLIGLIDSCIVNSKEFNLLPKQNFKWL